MTVQLATTYLNLPLRNPLVVSASPMTAYATTLQQFEAAGAGAVVLPSLFEEQITRDSGQTTSSSEIHLPSLSNYNTGPDGYLEHIGLAKKSISIPVIGSINCQSRGNWERFASLIEQAGADALELNIYFIPTSVEMSTAAVEDRYVDILTAVRAAVSIPVAVKLGPYFAALPNFAARLAQAGAQGLVLFNRFLEPEFDLENLAIRPHLELSDPRELRLTLRWIGILYGQVPGLSLAATSGIHTSTELIKALLAGADVGMCASTLLRHGPNRITEMLDGLTAWLEQKKFASVDDIRGLLSRNTYHQPSEFERANYLEAISTFSRDFG